MALINLKDQLRKLDRIGRMDRRITFIQRIITDGDSNEDYTGGWEEIDPIPTVWAMKQDLRGKEVVVADKVQFMYLTVWTVRHREDIKASMRLVDTEQGQVYEIVTLSEGEGRKAYLDVVTNILENETWT
jgi:SPP1 family predicted phage head-tail adaptor